ncbi:MAG TPA: ATPase, T2SS/T4P/T4SS family, partial [Dokdonella sp.]
ALKNAMREAPDVILIGEIRDRETMQHAIAYAETGHLCLSTLHANNANQTLDRIVNFFPDTARHQLLIDLSLNLRAVISQRLVPTVEGRRVPAIELLLRTPYIADLIAKGEISELKEAMKQGAAIGMTTFDQSLYKLYAEGRIAYKTALVNADSQTDLALQIRLSGPAPSEGHVDPQALTLVDLEPPTAPEERHLR